MTTETTMTIEYGATYNLGNFENEKISIRITVGPDDTIDAAQFRARAFVEGMHAETIARRKRAEDIEQEQRSLRYTQSRVTRLRDDAELYKLTVTWDVPAKPDTDDELELLRWEVAALDAERKALGTALDAHREQLRQQQIDDWERERGDRQPLNDDGPYGDEDGIYGDNDDTGDEDGEGL